MVKTPDRVLEIPGRSDIYLRRTSATDAQELFDLISTPEQREHLRFQTWVADAKSLDDVRKNVKSRVAAINRGREMQYRIIEGLPDEKQARMVGTVTLYGRTLKDSAHLGYWLDRDSTGKGYAFDAASRLVSYAQEEWNLHELNLVIDPANTASEHLATKLGAHSTGYVYTPGQHELLWKAHYE